MPFLAALGAVEAGHRAAILLLGEATYLMKDYIVDQIDGVGWPPLQGIISQVIENGTPIHV
jgi:predicted peroxiredoxin